MMEHPDVLKDVDALNNFMTMPGPALVEMMKKIAGDFLILGAGGKMGISLSVLARRAADAAGVGKRIIAASRFSDSSMPARLKEAGVEVLQCDLMEEDDLANLPDVDNIIYMAGMKFGSTGRASETWAVNAYLAGRVAQRFRKARFAVFSSGNVYPLTRVGTGGCNETDPVGPIGEYAQSVLGRERMFEHFSRKYQIACSIIRLNYAIDLRYGVLYDVAQKVYRKERIDLTMGHANVIWQGDANTIALLSLQQAGTPPFILNVTGRETISIRNLAEQFGRIFNSEPVFGGTEADSALLSDASLASQLYALPGIMLDDMIRWTGFWVKNELPTLNKPTHFETRDGKF